MRIVARLETETTIRQVSAPTTRMTLRSHPLLSRTVWLWICHRCGPRMAEEETFRMGSDLHVFRFSAWAWGDELITVRARSFPRNA